MGCVAACKFHSTPPQKCNNNTLLYLRSHPLSQEFAYSLLGLSPGGFPSSVGIFGTPSSGPALGPAYASFIQSCSWQAGNPMVHYTIGDLANPGFNEDITIVPPVLMQLQSCQFDVQLGLQFGGSQSRLQFRRGGGFLFRFVRWLVSDRVFRSRRFALCGVGLDEYIGLVSDWNSGAAIARCLSVRGPGSDELFSAVLSSAVAVRGFRPSYQIKQGNVTNGIK